MFEKITINGIIQGEKCMERTENLIMQEDRWKPLKEMNLTDDFLFDVATAELENCKTIIELSTGLRLKSLKWKEGQKVIHNIPGKRGIRMDFVAESEDGRVFDVEMQNRKEGNIPKRTRFYQALMDAPMLKSGEKGFDKLKPLFIIVICDYDPYGMKKYCYTFESRCKEQPDLLLGDEVTKLFLSTKGENGDEVSKELVDFLHYKNKYKCGGRVYEDGRKRKTGKKGSNRTRFKGRKDTRKNTRRAYWRRTACQFINESFKAKSSGR